MKSGRHVRAKPRARRLLVPARRPFGFTRERETSASREVRNDAILREVEGPFEGSKDTKWCTLLETPMKRRKLCVAGHHDEVQRSELRGQENLVSNTDLIETVELVHLIGQAVQGLYNGEARHESRRAHAHELPGA